MGKLKKQFEIRNLLTGIAIGLTVWVFIVAAGCSKSSGGGGIDTNPNGGAAYSPTACADPSCGLNYGTNYIALSPQAQQYMIQYYNSYAGYDTSGTFRANRLSYTNILPLLRDAMGVCNREYYNGGMADCSTWNSAAHVMILSSEGNVGSNGGQAVAITLWSAFMNDSAFQYSYQFPQLKYLLFGLFGVPMPTNNQAFWNPMRLQATIWPVNNNTGIEIRANGPTGSPAATKVFQLQIPTGKIGDAAFDFRMFMQGQALSTGRLVLCQSPACQYGY